MAITARVTRYPIQTLSRADELDVAAAAAADHPQEEQDSEPHDEPAESVQDSGEAMNPLVDPSQREHRRGQLVGGSS